MVTKVVNDKGNVENKTATELDILAKIERAYYKNNPRTQKRNTQKSLKWFSQYIPRSWNRARTSQMFRDQSLWSDGISPGQMYFYEYDAKTKETLPVWDRYPIIFPWDVWRGGNGKFGEPGVMYFIGINLHYLPPALRFAAMQSLLKLRNEKRYRRQTKLQISWEVLQSLSQTKLFEHSVKIYRMDHVKSKFVRIPPQSWEMAVFLPLARFQKGGKSAAWSI